MTTHIEELERTLASDPSLAGPEHAATIKLARDLATELDSQIANDGTGQTRTIATYAGLLGNLRRIIRDERELRRRGTHADKPASRLALIKEQAQKTTAS
jgi:hypothetical protein